MEYRVQGLEFCPTEPLVNRPWNRRAFPQDPHTLKPSGLQTLKPSTPKPSDQTLRFRNLQTLKPSGLKGLNLLLASTYRCRLCQTVPVGGVPREQKMLKAQLPRVIYHRVYSNIRRISDSVFCGRCPRIITRGPPPIEFLQMKFLELELVMVRRVRK